MSGPRVSWEVLLVAVTASLVRTLLGRNAPLLYEFDIFFQQSVMKTRLSIQMAPERQKPSSASFSNASKSYCQLILQIYEL